MEHATGRQLQGVSVSLRGTRHRTMSNQEGGFAFAQLDAGVYWLEFRLIGYAERTDSVRLGADGRVEIEVRLDVSPVGLPPITVTVGNRSIAAWLASKGFPQRGFEGRAMVHLTHQQIRLKSSQDLSELVRSVPGVRLRRLVDGGSQLLLEPDPRTGQGSCKVGVYLNGANVEFGNFNWMGPRVTDRGSRPIRFNELVRMSEIDGLELYGPESNPVASDSTCGTLILWNSSLRNQVDEAFTGTIRGTAVDSRTGNVIPGVRVLIDGTGLSAVTDASGKFELPDVLPGSYIVSAHYENAESWRTDVDVTAYGIVELTLQLERHENSRSPLNQTKASLHVTEKTDVRAADEAFARSRAQKRRSPRLEHPLISDLLEAPLETERP